MFIPIIVGFQQYKLSNMRLTQNVINDAPSFISPTDSRVLSLRNLNLTSLDSIHILKSTDIYSIIDLTKNSIIYLPEFPILFRLRTLNLSNNHIRTLTGLSNLVNLEVLSLTYNEIGLLSDLEHLQSLKSLSSLYLVGNPVTYKENYRLWCIWRFPKLQVLDFQRIKDCERKQAIKLFSNNEDKIKEILTEKSQVIDGKKSLTSETKKLTQEERDQLENELLAADSLEDIQRIEEILNRGHL